MPPPPASGGLTTIYTLSGLLSLLSSTTLSAASTSLSPNELVSSSPTLLTHFKLYLTIRGYFTQIMSLPLPSPRQGRSGPSFFCTRRPTRTFSIQIPDSSPARRAIELSSSPSPLSSEMQMGWSTGSSTSTYRTQESHGRPGLLESLDTQASDFSVLEALAPLDGQQPSPDNLPPAYEGHPPFPIPSQLPSSPPPPPYSTSASSPSPTPNNALGLALGPLSSTLSPSFPPSSRAWDPPSPRRMDGFDNAREVAEPLPSPIKSPIISPSPRSMVRAIRRVQEANTEVIACPLFDRQLETVHGLGENRPESSQ